MKKFCTLLLAILLLLSCSFTMAASEDSPEKQYVFDDAMDLLGQAEEEKLNLLLEEISDRIDADLVVVLTDDCYDEEAAHNDANVFYRHSDFRTDGAIFYCAIEDGYWNMQGFGEIKDIFSEDVLDLLEESCLPLVREEDYYDAFLTFAETTEEVVELDRDGTPYKGAYPWLKYLLIALVLGIVVALIVVLVLKGQLKSVHRQAAARNYLKQGSLNLTEQRDLYLYRTVSRVAKPKNTSSGGGGGGGGSRSGRI